MREAHSSHRARGPSRDPRGREAIAPPHAIVVVPHDRAVNIVFIGPLDDVAARELAEAIERQIDDGRLEVRLDLGNVGDVETGAFQRLVRAIDLLEGSGGRLTLTCVDGGLRRRMLLAGVLERIDLNEREPLAGSG